MEHRDERAERLKGHARKLAREEPVETSEQVLSLLIVLRSGSALTDDATELAIESGHVLRGRRLAVAHHRGVRRGEDRAGVREELRGAGPLLLLDLVLAVEVVVGVLVEG